MLGHDEFVFMGHPMIGTIGVKHYLEILLRKEEKNVEHGNLKSAYI